MNVQGRLAEAATMDLTVPEIPDVEKLYDDAFTVDVAERMQNFSYLEPPYRLFGCQRDPKRS